MSSPDQLALAWLQTTYRGLVEPAMAQPVHETATSWLMACRTVPQPGYPHTPMLASSLVVPKDHTAPFGLPNSDPWNWFARWDGGEMPGTADLPSPPPPGHAAWFGPTLAELGQVLSVSDHPDWAAAMEAISELPVGTRALLWVRRTDGRGREAVGLLVNALRLETGTVVVDGSSGSPVSFDPTGVHLLHVIRYR
ncbi:YrhB domain-containing protein [Streptomyces sp. GMY02]|uniref:YrhB domain-containing protein n=1 Tax=Streptomyces sp. GMY02 TaxID=1333528 RepID=UPI001F408619|nr:YrhB domain-containing protein [Streptomyces sp. GMY02]